MTDTLLAATPTAADGPGADAASSTASDFFKRAVGFARRYGRWVLLALGLVGVVVLVWHVGPAALWATLVEAAPWLLLIIGLEAAWITVESIGLLAFFGEHGRRIPAGAWMRSLMTQYATMFLLPVGRAGAEVARAAMLAPYVGKERAAAGAVQLQSMILVANTVASLACLAAVVQVTGFGGSAVLLAINAWGTLFLGVGLYLVARQVKLGGWLGRRFKSLASWGPELDLALSQSPRLPLVPLFFCVAGRAVQILQYGVILLAIGGTLTLHSSLVAEGIHLVAAGFGDMVPNQVGITEGAYRLFAGDLGLAAHPEKALAIALIARLSGLSLSLLCLLGTALWRPTPAAKA